MYRSRAFTRILLTQLNRNPSIPTIGKVKMYLLQQTESHLA